MNEFCEKEKYKVMCNNVLQKDISCISTTHRIHKVSVSVYSFNKTTFCCCSLLQLPKLIFQGAITRSL